MDERFARDPHARIVYKPVAPASDSLASSAQKPANDGAFLRAANEDDDGYDPYSDRPAQSEPLFQEDPWS